MNVYVTVFVTCCPTRTCVLQVMYTCVMFLETKRPFSSPSDPSVLQMSLFLHIFRAFQQRITTEGAHTHTHTPVQSRGVTGICCLPVDLGLLPDHMASIRVGIPVGSSLSNNNWVGWTVWPSVNSAMKPPV